MSFFANFLNRYFLLKKFNYRKNGLQTKKLKNTVNDVSTHNSKSENEY